MSLEHPASAESDRAAPGGRKRVFLHVGAPKTGTTYLQTLLWTNRKALARAGVLYPGQGSAAHFHASLDLRGAQFKGHDDPRVPGAWARVASAARKWRGHTVLISHETLAGAREEHVRRAVESLQPAEVHVIYTARDLARQIPAVWQESVKNRRSAGFPRFLRSLKSARARGTGKVFWGGQDVVEVLRRWNVAVPADRIHLVTVPPRGGPQSSLWERFAWLLGVNPEEYETDMGRSNVSLGSVEAELLRRINRMVPEDLEWPRYAEWFKHGLAERHLAERTDSQRITLPPRWYPWVLEQSQRMVDELREAKYDVVGDLEELIPPKPAERGAAGAPAPRPDPDAVLDVAAETIARLVMERPARAGARGRTWRGMAGAVAWRARRLAWKLRLRD